MSEIRITDATEDQDPRLELWTVTDNQNGSGGLVVECKTMYKLRIKKKVETEVLRHFDFDDRDFSKLFGLRKSEVERPILVVFCERLLRTLSLFMPTLNMQNKDNHDDSDKEEEVYIR